MSWKDVMNIKVYRTFDQKTRKSHSTPHEKHQGDFSGVSGRSRPHDSKASLDKDADHDFRKTHTSQTKASLEMKPAETRPRNFEPFYRKESAAKEVIVTC